jgi:hypothetical protein
MYGNGVGRRRGASVAAPPGIDQLYYLGKSKDSERSGPLVNVDLCIGDKVSVFDGNDHLDKGFGNGAVGTFVGLFPDPSTIPHRTQKVTLPNGVISTVWEPLDVGLLQFVLVDIPTMGDSRFRCAGFDMGIYPCGRASTKKSGNKTKLRVSGMSYRADQFHIRRCDAKTVHKSQGQTERLGRSSSTSFRH